MSRPDLTRGGDDSGQLSLLIAGYLLVALLAIGVAVDTSSLFLHRRSLQSAADASALAVAHQLDASQVYAPTPEGDLVLRDDAGAVVRQFIADHHYDESFHDLRLVSVSISPEQQVTLTLTAHVPLPLGGFVDGDGIDVTVTAHARSHVLSAAG